MSMRPEEIEKKSMEIISAEMNASGIEPVNLPVVKRVIHATADFDFAGTLRFSPGAVEAGRRALRAGAAIVTDTNMAAAGVSKPYARKYGNEIRCWMADEEIARLARERGVTRAEVSMELAVGQYPGAVFAIGNAPTALLRLCELIRQGTAKPSLVIGVPVGFVNVVESKETLLGLGVPHIAARGRKGGSAVAAAILNALYYGGET
jgi:precorrin-8X/cobalt-precorrin-8 methylmutase